MRRPGPLPPSPEETESVQAPSGHRRVVDEPRDPVELHGAAPEHSAAADDVAGEPEGLEGLTARDVWRAARARRKRLRAEIRRFTQRSRRRRLIWLGALGALVLLVGGSVIAAYSPLFAVEKITVAGASSLDPATIEAALEGQIGTPLALVDESEVKAALIAFPLIETYALEARPPHDLTVRIVERTPIGVIESDAGYTLVDAAGVALSTTAEQSAGQPVLHVDGGIDSDAFESVGLVVRSVPADVREALVEVTASTVDDVTLRLSSGLTVVWGSAEESVEKARTLVAAMAANPGASKIDVSSPDVVVAG
ncbi:FtsQ-type POTRA domain-containing protein [Microbacterium aerolatum]|uniref:FtsQ-type POTRA domain-containing protein n=1 Tax=Microbacterium aerolatum TaxID=153731 RepID=UPI0020014365|nr:FtsQ-type POTRA domain-containing protein [Microbacterium aerolatum]MCK3770504.1 FtsQ-type POTRA domain-containing protein [Microbacterium aerolatum]